MSNVITRFAPSPTGSLHVGGARTALFNYLFAKHNGGKFLLRIEDTDTQRSTIESSLSITRDLKWLGIEWDNEEVPTQSSRVERYNGAIDFLLNEDEAYEQDGAVYLRMPKLSSSLDDLILGTINLAAEESKDFVIRKSDGMPVYHLAVVVDDRDYGVTHVIRGQEHLLNTFRHVRLQQALNYRTPQYAHLPIILNMDGTKMSKRQDAKVGEEITVADFRRNGYIPEAMNNFLALLGWHPGDDQTEHLRMDDMIHLFGLNGVNKSNAKFDRKKLLAFNGRWGRSLLDDHREERLNSLFEDFIGENPRSPLNAKRPASWFALCQLCKGFRTFADVEEKCRFLARHVLVSLLDRPRLTGNEKWLMASLSDRLCSDGLQWTAEELKRCVEQFAEDGKADYGTTCNMLRRALTGQTVSPPVFETMELMGERLVMLRVGYAMA